MKLLARCGCDHPGAIAMSSKTPFRFPISVVVLLLGSCSDLREARDHERKQERFEEQGIVLPDRSPLPPVPVF
jgi:hypothetical protein